MAELEGRQGKSARNVAEDLLRWLKLQVSGVQLGKGEKSCNFVPFIEHHGTKYRICNMDTMYGFGFRPDLCKKRPFTDVGVRDQLLAKLNEIPGMNMDDARLTSGWCTTFAKLTSPEAVEKLKCTMSYVIEAIKAECEKGPSVT